MADPPPIPDGFQLEGAAPPIPDGFTLEGAAPPIPDGFTLEGAAPPIPDGFTLEPPSIGAQALDKLGQLTTGVAKGSAAMAGQGGDLRNAAIKYGAMAADKLGHPIDPATIQKIQDASDTYGKYVPSAIPGGGQSTEQLLHGIPLKDAQTPTDEYLQTLGEFAPGLLGRGQGLIRRAATQVVLPAMATETAGQLTKGNAVEPYARFGTAIASGGLGSILDRPGTTTQILRNHMPEGVTQAHVDQAQALMHYEPTVPVSGRPETLWYQGIPAAGVGKPQRSEYWTANLDQARDYAGSSGYVHVARESDLPSGMIDRAQGGRTDSLQIGEGGNPATLRQVKTVATLPRDARNEEFHALGAASPISGLTARVPLTFPEALSQVMGRPVLTDAQRLLESSGDSRTRMQNFMADRPQRIEDAGASMLDTVAPPTANPSMIGPRAGEAAEGTIGDIRKAINRATKPMYDASGQTLVPVPVHAAMMNDPLFEDALNAVRDHPAKNALIRGQSDRSIAVYDAVKQELNERAENAAGAINPQKSQTVSAVTGNLAGDVRDIATAADRQATGGPSSYEAARETQARLRQQYLEPVLNGPLGKIAAQPETRSAIEALFPSDPLGGSANEVSTAVSALARRNPWAATQLVRAHMEQVFDQSTRNLTGGANSYGGAKFAARLVGNRQQRANLQAAVEALPNGQQTWPGINRFLDVMEATGKRQAIGSRTAFNTEDLKSLSSGSFPAETLKLGASPGKWMNFINDKWSRWQLGQNLNELTSVITDPRSGPLFRRIAGMPINSRESVVTAARLVAQATAGSRDSYRRPANEQSPQPQQ